MRTIKLRTLLWGPAAALALVSAVQAASLPPGAGPWTESVAAHFNRDARETQVIGRVTQGLCFSFAVAEEWHADGTGPEARLTAVSSGVSLKVSLRSAHDLQHMPQPDLASRDAAFLQRDYEELLGRPAQSVSLASFTPGAARWSATWVDGNLPMEGRAMTVETFIVPLSSEWVLELSMDNIDAHPARSALMHGVLSGLRVRGGASCRT